MAITFTDEDMVYLDKEQDMQLRSIRQAIDYHDGMYVPEGVHSNLNTFTSHYPFAFKYANQHGIQVNDMNFDISKCLKGWPKAESVRVISKFIRR